MSAPCRIRIRIADREIEVEGDEDFVKQTYDELKSDLLGTTVQHRIPESGTDEAVSSRPPLEQAPSLGEFIKQKGAKSHTDRLVTMAAYMYLHEGMREFTKPDLDTHYEQALLAGPKNMRDTISRNRKKAYITDSGRKSEEGLKLFRITQDGLDYVERGLKTK